MTVSRPYYRIVRKFVDGHYSEGGRSQYIHHPAYAEAPSNCVRAFLLIQKDLQTVLEYIQPSGQNLQTYSFRTYEALLRTCTEIEANFKAIFRANIYSYAGNMNVTHYSKINKSHFLSDYEVKMPYWDDHTFSRKPFQTWGAGTHSLAWYQAYNNSKHDRAQNLIPKKYDRPVSKIQLRQRLSSGLIANLKESNFYAVQLR